MIGDTDNQRKSNYLKDNYEEELIQNMNSSLLLKEIELLQDIEITDLPIVFIVGAQRTGSTLLMQLLLNQYKFAYPNNLIARFWDSPLFGSILYKSLSKETSFQSTDFSSDLGYTKGINGPHEFGYFWRRWFPKESYEKGNWVFESQQKSILQKEVSAIARLFDLPVIFKNLVICSFYIEELYSIFPNALFLHIERDPLDTMISTYQARERLFEDDKVWFGLKPPQYEELSNLEVHDQIAGQVYYTVQSINKQLEKVPEKNRLALNYSDLVGRTSEFLSEFEKSMKSFNYSLLKSGNDIPIFGKKEKNEDSIELIKLMKEASRKYY